MSAPLRPERRARVAREPLTSRLPRSLPPVLFALAAQLAGAPAAAESVTFAFAPPTGASFEFREWGTIAYKWGAHVDTLAIGQRSGWTFAPEGSGLRLTEATQELAMAKEGKPFHHPLLEASAKSTTVYHLAADGALQRMDGLRSNTERVVAALEGEAKESAKKRLAEGRLGESERWLWFERFEILAGQTLELDRDYWFRTAAPSDDGWVAYQVLFRLGPWETTPAGRRLRVQLAYVADALATIPAAVELRPKIRTRFDPAAPGKVLTGYQIRGNASRLVDPATGLVWREQAFRRETHVERPVEEIGISISIEARTDFTLTPLAP